MRISYAYFSEHVVDESSFRCDAKTIECRMDIHVRRVANISDMNVQVTGIAAVDKVDQHVRHDAALLMVGWFGVFGSSQCDGTFAIAQLLQIPPGQESLATKVNIRGRCGQNSAA